MKKITARTSGFIRSTVASISLMALLVGAAGAHASTPTVSIVNISPSATVAVGTPLTLAVATSGFIDPYYSMSDAFIGGSLGSIDLNSAGELSWTPARNDVGSHVVTITAHDTQNDVAVGTVTLTVTNNSTGTLSIGALSPSSTITAGQAVSFMVTPAGLSGTPTYSLTDSFSGSSISNSDINSSGDFSWTTATSDVGTHTITITGEDSYGNVATNSVTIVINPPTVDTPVVTTTVSPAVPETPIATVAPFTENLAVGSTGTEVTALQELLTAQGDFSASITDYYGAETKAAVIKFQAAHGIQQLGIVGPSTRTALNALETGTTATVTASTDTTSDASALAEIQDEVASIESEITLIKSQLTAL
jgi:hypothetical protein